jgi:hypothetical protein
MPSHNTGLKSFDRTAPLSHRSRPANDGWGAVQGRRRRLYSLAQHSNHQYLCADGAMGFGKFLPVKTLCKLSIIGYVLGLLSAMG